MIGAANMAAPNLFEILKLLKFPPLVLVELALYHH
jgi:hypothetical protein